MGRRAIAAAARAKRCGTTGPPRIPSPRSNPWGQIGANYAVVDLPSLVAASVASPTSTRTALLLADAYIELTVVALTTARITTGLRVGSHRGQWGSFMKLQSAVAEWRQARTSLAVSGASGAICEANKTNLEAVGVDGSALLAVSCLVARMRRSATS